MSTGWCGSRAWNTTSRCDIVDNWDGPVIPRSQTRDAEEDARRTASALKWWDAAKPIAGTLAARYLADIRGIDLDALPANIDDALRFHPHCPFGPGVTHPCLLALMRDPISDAPTGIQRIALTTDAQKIDRMMLGPSGVVKLWPAGKQLVIGEGLETTLAAATRLPYRGEPLRPAWAALSDGGMRRFPVIDGVERLILLADHDHNGAGQAAAEECKRRWQQAGRSGVAADARPPGGRFQRHRHRHDAGARTMSNGFTAEEFEPDTKANGSNTQDSGSSTKANGAGTQQAANGHDADPPPVLGADAYYGLAGEVVSTIAPQTEADPVALLLQLLVYGGNAIGRGPYFQVGKDRHYTNLFGLLVGDTAKARKGLSAGHIRDFYMRIDPEWAEHRIRTGMSSGEGIIHHVRDQVSAMRKGEMKIIDPGVTDKRLLIDEREFQSALTVMQRQGNTLSTVIRDAWDCRPVLETLTKKEPTKATRPFISIVGHITIDELQESLDRTAMANGYANRFLFAYVHRSKELPLGGDDVDLTELIEQDPARH